jgi:hypothetical protein
MNRTPTAEPETPRSDTETAAPNRPDDEHLPPPGVSDELVAALGKLSEALETTERARGCLYSFHQLTGHADLMLDDAVDQLRDAGADALAERVETELIGRNLIAGRWSFQIVEDYDDGYYETFRRIERDARNELVQGRRHLYEAAMKEERRTRGLAGHAARPPVTDQEG